MQLNQEILSYLKSKVYSIENGIKLLEKYSKNKVLVGILNKRKNLEKIIYELKKIAGIPLTEILNTNPKIEKNAIQKPINSRTTTNNDSRISNPTTQNRTQNPLGKTIPINDNLVLQTKNKIADLTTKIAVMHKELFNIGENNDPKSVEKRKKLLNKRKLLINYRDQLYNAKENFFNGKISINDLKTLNEITFEETLKEIKKKDISEMSKEELIKQKKLISNKISHLNNLLKYQCTTKQVIENPLPEGSKRSRYIHNIKEAKELNKKINNLLKKL